MHCQRCNELLEKNAAFCGNCGQPVVHEKVREKVYAVQIARAESIWSDAKESNLAEKQLDFPLASPKTPAPPVYARMPTPAPPSPLSAPMPRPHHTSNLPAKNLVFLAIVLSLLILGISAGFIALLQNKHLASQNASAGNAAAAMTGSITFLDGSGSQENTDSLKINISGLTQAPSGSHYAAWLVDDQTEHTMALGKLTAQNTKGQPFSLNFTDKGQNLLGLGDKLQVTLESGDTTLPAGRVILIAQFPPLAFIHIKHLLVSFPTTPRNIGLLVGLRGQIQQVNTQALLLKNLTNQPKATACAAQGMINLIEGSHGVHTQQLSSACSALNVAIAGDGFGLLGQNGNGYVAGVAMHASLAATQPDATDTIRTYAHDVIGATDYIKGWLTSIDQDAQALVAHPGDSAKVQDMITLSGNALNGSNGEGGAIMAYKNGQAMATLTLTP